MTTGGLTAWIAVGAVTSAMAGGAVWLADRYAPLSEASRSAVLAGAAGIAVAVGVVGFGLLARSAYRRAGELLEAETRPEEIAPERAGWLSPVVAAGRRGLVRWAAKLDESSGKLREAEIRLSLAEAECSHAESILDSLRDAVLVTDQFNEVMLANSSAERLLGVNDAGAEHKPLDQVVSDESLRQMIKDVSKSGVSARQKRVEHTMPAEPAAGSPNAAFDVTIACLPEIRNTPGGVVTILRDVTREKEIAQMKSDFVSQASHELRTPLASINAYVEMLIDGEAATEEARGEFYSIIKGEVDRVSRMIDNMLNISRIEAGIISIERSEVDFAKVVREVVETMQPQAKAKRIMLIEKVGPLIYTAEADRDMMYQVVMNLVSNAIKYTPEEGRVTVSVENDDASRSVLVAVQDTGLGIPPEARARLFEKFFRVENYKRFAKGTGLGLNLVRQIVETVHRGKIDVDSEVGMGSRFWFTVPYEFQGGQS